MHVRGDPHTAIAQRNHPQSSTLLRCSRRASRVTVSDSSLFSCPEHTPSSRCSTASTRATFSRRAVASWWMPSGAHKTWASPTSMYLQVRGEEDGSHHEDLQEKHCGGSEIMCIPSPPHHHHAPSPPPRRLTTTTPPHHHHAPPGEPHMHHPTTGEPFNPDIHMRHPWDRHKKPPRRMPWQVCVCVCVCVCACVRACVLCVCVCMWMYVDVCGCV